MKELAKQLIERKAEDLVESARKMMPLHELAKREEVLFDKFSTLNDLSICETMCEVFEFAGRALVIHGNVKASFMLKTTFDLMNETAKNSVDQMHAHDMEVKALKDVIAAQDELLGE